MVANFNPSVGSCVWVEDPDEAWIDGEIVEVNGEELKVLCTSGKHVVTKVSNVYPKDVEAPSSGVDDMTRLVYLHEPGVLQNLHSRYDINEIYTYTGSILIAVNPFRRLPHLYSSHMMAQYIGAALGELSPHPFAIADAAYRQMINDGVSQSILVSGESGAGKTESTKLLMRYLAYMGGRAAVEGRSVEKKVLESNPVLEAFGNAKTVRNNNSSRFGKFVEIQFDEKGRISGAAIKTYLLERSRVCQVSDPERNYHCFYMLCAAPQEDVQKFKLGEPKRYHYLNQSRCLELDSINDAEEYHATRRAMDVVGISTEEQDAIFSVVAAILHLGNVEFAKGAEIDSSIPKDEASLFHLKTAAELLSCDEKALEDSLCKRITVTRDETITKTLDPEAATLSRDALAKVMYSRLFDWLVYKINSSIGQDPDSKYLIGVLDIYGFESFKKNSFEQFCINLTNEKLQQHFNQHVFKMEQEEYKKEEINWSYIEFVDNQDILDLIEKKPGGIIAQLDEACMFPRSTHEIFVQKLYQTFKNHKHFTKPKLACSDFTICHYAGDVTYQTELFLDKNKDYVIAEHHALLNSSSCSFVASLFPPMSDDSKQSRFSSVGSRLKRQLGSLFEILSTTEPHYIRCIKPNNLLRPGIFENENILQQLRCGGMMEAIRISCAGYPTRKHFDDFLARFGILAPEVLVKNSDDPAACKKLLDKVGLEGYQIGKTKIFLRAGQMADLDTRRTEVLGRSASIIQRKVRSYLAKKSFILLRNSAKQIQSVCRGYLARSVYEAMRREAAALKIQRDLRMFLPRKAYIELFSTAVSVQAGMRGIVALNELYFRRQTKAAIIIQTWGRGYLARLHYIQLKKAAITTQCAWRSKIARRKLQKRMLEMEIGGALPAAKNKLEKQVEELTWRLQLEKQTTKISQDRLKQALEAGSKLVKLKTAMQRVFNSFHGPDVPKTFVSHLRKQFNYNGITMFDNQGIERSQIIAPVLTQVIRESRISIVVLSKNYASSIWCLDELLEILKCKEDVRQIVTVFYGVDPSDVRKQTGDFGIAFNETCARETEEQRQKWSRALTYVGNIAGEHFQNWDNEAEMIEKIARDVSDKLNTTQSRDFDGMVGLEAHLRKMESLLDLDNDGVKVVGISGPAGIGKSNIARALHSRLSNRFQHTCFVENLGENYKLGLDEYDLKLRLQEQLLSKILNQNGMQISHLGVIKERLHDKKVLIILDDVESLDQVEALANIMWFGVGSRVIVTTENKMILQQHGINDIYNVGFPSGDEALMIFCLYAFRQTSPPDGFMNLANEVVRICGNLPLGLHVYGSSLRGKSQADWIEELPRLKNCLDGRIESVLKVGFESLCEKDQTLFLHIAVFFNYEHVDHVRSVLAKSNLDVRIGLKILANKYLIHIDRKSRVVMHHLLQVMARQVISKQDRWKRQILVDTPEISYVLEDATGDRSIQGVSFDVAEMDTLMINPRAFENMHNLLFLKVYNVGCHTGKRKLHIPEDIEFPRRIRLFHWEAYPGKSLPLRFFPGNLVELNMERSELEKLWEGTQPLANLKRMILRESACLKELPDLSNATNLERLDLFSCTALVEVPSSIANLHKIGYLNMEFCKSLEVIPTFINLVSLKLINMFGCSRLRSFPDIPPNITILTITVTGVEEFPASLRHCSRLKSVNIHGSRNLNTFLTHLPTSVNTLALRYSGIERITDCIKGLHNLENLYLSSCKRLESLPELPGSLIHLRADNCESLMRVSVPLNTPNARLEFTNCFKLSRQARQAIIQQSFVHGWALLPGKEVPADFDHRARGTSITIPHSTFSRFKVCIVISPNHQAREFMDLEVSCRCNFVIFADMNFRLYDISEFQMEHLFVFHSSLPFIDTSEVSRKRVFEFSSRYQDLNIIECGIQILTGENEESNNGEFGDEDDDNDHRDTHESVEASDKEEDDNDSVANGRSKSESGEEGVREQLDEELSMVEAYDDETRSLLWTPEESGNSDLLTSGVEAAEVLYGYLSPTCEAHGIDPTENPFSSLAVTTDLKSAGGMTGVTECILVFSCNVNLDVDETCFIEAISKELHKREVTPLTYNLLGRENLDEEMLYRSRVGIMILSDGYACSRQSLDHLVELMEHRKATNLVIIPIYFKATLSDICGLEGRFEPIYLQYMESAQASRVQKWKAAMAEIASVDGHEWTKEKQVLLAEEVVRNACLRLYLKNSKNVLTILAFLHHSQPSDAEIVGLWGMAGIGKTSIAREIFGILAPQYDLCYFLHDFDLMYQKKGRRQMRDDFLSKVFREDKLSISACDIKPSFMRDWFCSKTILVVLDDVSDARDVEAVVGGFGWFSNGHRIILTSRRKQVLVQCKVKELYEIQKLCETESFRLCKQYLNGRSVVISELMSCSSGIPLALEVLGSSVSKQHIINVKEHIQRLRKNPPTQIQEAFHRSFDGLDEKEKNIFLDLACFFAEENKEHVVQLLDACGFLTYMGICDLIDESLISLLENRIQIPIPFQDIGRFIVHEEAEDPCERSRLWDSRDIADVLTNNSGTEAIEGIFLDVSDLTCELSKLSPTVFGKMNNLRLLKLYCSTSGNECKLSLPQGLDTLPDELRLLHWENYPLEYLPQNFNPENLVEINMPYSNMEKLWEGKKNLETLKKIKLSHSRKLADIRMLSGALNLEDIDLEGCTSLVDISTSIPPRGKLVSLNMKDCSHLRSLPAMVDLTSLNLLTLSGCAELREIQDFAPNLKELYLAGTAITELPSSIDNLTKLVVLDLENCKRLQKLPFGIRNSRSIVDLKLSGCTMISSTGSISERRKGGQRSRRGS